MPCLSRSVLSCAAASLALALTVVMGCDPSRNGATGTVNLRITDAPFPVDLISEATVTITRIELRMADAQQGEQPESTESEPADDGTAAGDEAAGDGTIAAASKSAKPDKADNGGQEGDATGETQQEDTWVTVFTGSATFNLLDLRNGKSDVLANATVPAGTYTQMRLFVTAGSVTLKDGRQFDLKVPSGAQSGIKLNFTFTVEEGQQKPLLLDVDLSRAFKPIPGVGAKRPEDIREFKFQPSLAMRLINVVQAGSISGTVSSASGPLSGATVTAVRDGQEVTSTTTESDGTCTLTGLAPGTYSVTFSADGYTDKEVTGVVVEAGKTTAGVDATLEAETPAP